MAERTVDALLASGPHLRRYDSPKARELEAWRSTRRDAQAVTETIDLIFEPRWPVEESSARVAFALWDSSMVRLFRHYTNSPIPEIPKLYNDLARDMGLENDLVIWKQDRDKRVAHPVGHNEFYTVIVQLTDTQDDVEEIKFPAGELFYVEETIKPVGRYARALQDAVTPICSRLKTEVEAEIRSLSPAQLAGLHPYFLHAHGRRYGA